MTNKNHYVIVRTYSAGCFAGELITRNGKEVELSNARRLWYWDGAQTLSELAVSGTAKPDKCKFPAPVLSIVVTEAIEIITTTGAAEKSIRDVPIWSAR